MHLCLCGCGRKVVTPLGRAGWEVRVRRGRVSVFPSIGNGAFPCRSHYWIQDGRVIWMPRVTEEEHDIAIARDESGVETRVGRWPRCLSGLRGWLRGR